MSGRPVAVYGDEIKVGDVLLIGETPHLLADIEPYEHPTVPGCLGMARAAGDFSISLWPFAIYEVVR